MISADEKYLSGMVDAYRTAYVVKKRRLGIVVNILQNILDGEKYEKTTLQKIIDNYSKNDT